MKDAQKANQITLANLIRDLQAGRFVIPDFQRSFVWQPADIRELTRSVFLDYYIGNLLLWRGKMRNFDSLACENIYGYEGGDDGRTYIVLDGQQRLTALYYALVGPDRPAPGKKSRFLYFIRADKFMNEEYDEAFQYHWTARGTNILGDPKKQFDQHMFPLSTLGRSEWHLADWTRDYVEHWERQAERQRADGDTALASSTEAHAKNARDFRKRVYDIVQRYQVSYIELDRDLEIDKVCDIFTQINRRGVRLDIFDLINALIKPKGVELKHLWRDAQPRFDFLDARRMNVHVLQVMSILEQNYCSPKYLYYLIPGQERKVRGQLGGVQSKVIVHDAEHFVELWHRSVAALEEAVDLLQHPHEYGAVTPRFLPYHSILPAFAALRSVAKSLSGNLRLGAQKKIRYWYWASVFSNRYSSAVESTSARDYLDVTAWFDDDAAEPGLIAEFKNRVQGLSLREEKRQGTARYNGILCLLVLQGARDWIDGIAIRSDDVDDHHIVPRNWGEENGLGDLIDTVLNRVPLSSKTNRGIIGDRLPNQYLPELIETNGADKMQEIMESHLISREALDVLMRDPFDRADFDEFLEARERTLTDAIAGLVTEDPLRPSPRIRELDERIKTVEVLLRELIAVSLDNDPAALPEHVRAKIRDRLLPSRKNPGVDRERYRKLSGQLEFADLRELQAIVTSRVLWERFRQHFRDKHMLEGKFGQLAELRNCIRHSRHAGEVVRKEGEAAIIWFEKVLRRQV